MGVSTHTNSEAFGTFPLQIVVTSGVFGFNQNCYKFLLRDISTTMNQWDIVSDFI